MIYLTRDEMIMHLRKEINKSIYFYGKKRLNRERLMFLYSKCGNFKEALRLNRKFIRERRYWNRYFNRKKNLFRFSKIYIRSKNKQIYNILNKYKHYILTFKSFYSNFYVMLTDNKGNPLLSCSTGQVSYSRSKKKKNSMMLIYPMMQKVKFQLMKHGVKHLVIHLKTDINSKIVTAIKFLNYSRLKFKITYIALLKPTPHHFGRRKKKPRRI